MNTKKLPASKKILFWFFCAVLCVSVISIYLLYIMQQRDLVPPVVLGIVLSTLNVFAGYLSIELGLGKSISAFFKIVFGGIGIRLVFVLSALIISIAVFEMQKYVLISSFLICYIFFLFLEVFYIKYRLQQQNS